jgi:hypothetical protein
MKIAHSASMNDLLPDAVEKTTARARGRVAVGEFSTVRDQDGYWVFDYWVETDAVRHGK